MTNEELYDLLSFDGNIESVEIESLVEMAHDGEFITGCLHYPDGDIRLALIHYKGKDWLFTPNDWQSWMPESIDEIGEIEWRVNDTTQMAIIYDGQPALSPFAAEPEIICNARERIGNELRKAREEAGLTLRQLAEKTDIAFSHIGRIERGKYNVTLDTLSILAQALGREVGLVKYIPLLNSMEALSEYAKSRREKNQEE